MAKEAYVAIRIKVATDEYLEVGEPLDLKMFTKEQLQGLYDAGAIEVREVADPEPAKGPETKVDEPKKATEAKKATAAKAEESKKNA